jgi:uncharacterized protein
MTATVTAIYRYPVKGLSPEKLDRVALLPGECLPHDRRFAIALASAPFDPERPAWLAKTNFIMLMRDEELARLQTRFDVESDVLSIAENGTVLLRARMTDPGGAWSSKSSSQISLATGWTDRYGSSRRRGMPLPMHGAGPTR